MSPSTDDEPSAAETDPGSETLAGYAAGIVHETNLARSTEGLPELALSECAAQAGRERAAALSGEELEHAPLGPVVEECAPQGRAGENLAASTATPAEVVNAWLNSPGHRSNVLSPDFTEVGVGCAEHPEGIACSQIFLGSQ